MASTNTTLHPSSLKTIVNAFTTDHRHLAQLLSTINPAGYAAQELPPTPELDTRKPFDPEKMLDISLATSFITIITSAVSIELIEPVVVHHPANEATTVLVLLLSGLAYDRYALSAHLWHRIQRGLRRLFRDDTERNARVDAAAFLTAYLLGLPWICFRPDASQVLRNLDETAAQSEDDDAPMADDVGKRRRNVRRKKPLEAVMVQKCLIWLVAGIAVEDELDGLLIESDLRYARELLRGARIRRGKGRRMSDSDIEDMIRKAVYTAKSLLIEHANLHEELTNRMIRGQTVGDCVACIVESFDS